MNFLEKILDYVEEQPKAVIVTLLGIITIGSVCGGIVISSLKDTIEFKEKIVSEREQINKKNLTLKENLNEGDVKIDKRKDEFTEKAVDEFRKGFSSYSSTSDKIVKKLNLAMQSKRIERERKEEILEAIETIRAQSDEIEKAIEKAESFLCIASEMKGIHEKLINIEPPKKAEEKE